MDLSLVSLTYKQGPRQMFITVGDFPGTGKIVAKPSEWNPADPAANRNRPLDNVHRNGIRDYLINEPEPVIGGIVLYVGSKDARWDMVDGFDNLAYLRIRIGAQIEVNDGQHRLSGGNAVVLLNEKGELTDEAGQRITDMGVPFIVVIEDRAWKKAQDYADLQTNVKPPTGSLAMSMNRRIPFNKFVLDLALEAV